MNVYVKIHDETKRYVNTVVVSLCAVLIISVLINAKNTKNK
jgi:hypothetical protein